MKCLLLNLNPPTEGMILIPVDNILYIEGFKDDKYRAGVFLKDSNTSYEVTENIFQIRDMLKGIDALIKT